MTATIMGYLESTYPGEIEELKLVFQKANKFLNK